MPERSKSGFKFFKYFRTFILFTVTIPVAGVLLFPAIFLGPIGSFLNAGKEAKPADAIVVLLGSGTPVRVLDAFKLYNRGISGKLVFGTGFVDPSLKEITPSGLKWPRSSDRYIEGFKSLGVPESDIELVDTSSGYDTAGELRLIGRYGLEAGWKSINLVSGVTHTRRVSMIWKRVNPDIEGNVVATIAPGYENWWEHGNWRQKVGYELSALVKEFWAQLVNTFS